MNLAQNPTEKRKYCFIHWGCLLCINSLPIQNIMILWIRFRKNHNIFGFTSLVVYPFAFLIYSVGKHPKYFLKLVAK